MQATGFVRKLDTLGRLTIPSELRRGFDMEIHDPVEIYMDKDFIYLRKYEPFDIFTGEDGELIDYKGKKVSRASIEEMAQLAGLVGADR